jgi:hypothetical protein
LRLLAGEAEDVDVAGDFAECRSVTCLVDVAGGGGPDFAGEDGALVAELCGEGIEVNGWCVLLVIVCAFYCYHTAICGRGD